MKSYGLKLLLAEAIASAALKKNDFYRNFSDNT